MNIVKFSSRMSYQVRLTLNDGDTFLEGVHQHARPDGNPSVYSAIAPHMVYDFWWWNVGKTLSDDTYHVLSVYAMSFGEALQAWYRYLRLVAGGAGEQEAIDIINDKYEFKGLGYSSAAGSLRQLPITHAEIKARG